LDTEAFKKFLEYKFVSAVSVPRNLRPQVLIDDEDQPVFAVVAIFHSTRAGAVEIKSFRIMYPDADGPAKSSVQVQDITNYTRADGSGKLMYGAILQDPRKEFTLYRNEPAVKSIAEAINRSEKPNASAEEVARFERRIIEVTSHNDKYLPAPYRGGVGAQSDCVALDASGAHQIR